jgi:hypothetical protein
MEERAVERAAAAKEAGRGVKTGVGAEAEEMMAAMMGATARVDRSRRSPCQSRKSQIRSRALRRRNRRQSCLMPWDRHLSTLCSRMPRAPRR